MRRTYWKTVLREICGSLGRFFAIFAIVALGTGFLAGLIATAPDMRLSVDAYYDEAQVMDLRVVSTLGLTDHDVADVAATEGVAAVMPAYSTDALTTMGEHTDVVTRLHSLPQGDRWLNRVTVIEGRMPVSANECVVVRQKFADPPAVGTVITLSADNRDLSDTLTTTVFTVTGIVDSAQYFSIDKESGTVGNGTVSTILYVPADAFCAAAYSAIYVQVAGAMNEIAFSDKYEAEITAVKEKLEAQCDVWRQRRYDEVTADARDRITDARADYETQKADAEQQLADAKAKLDEARQQIADGEAAISDGRIQLAAKRQELLAAQEDYHTGVAELAAKRQELSKGQEQAAQQFAEQEQQLNDSEQELTAGQALLAAGKPALDQTATQLSQLREQIDALTAAGQTEQAAALQQLLTAGQALYDENLADYQAQETALAEAAQRLAAGKLALAQARDGAQVQFADAEAQLSAGEQKLIAAAAQLESGTAALAEAENTLQEKQRELSAGKTDLAQGEGDYEAARRETDDRLSDAEEQLREGEDALAAVALPTMFVLDRESIPAYASFDGNCDKVDAIAVVFPLFFFLVAALVALTTMTRMVEEQRTQIGVMRALGYGKFAVALKYLIYAGTATLAGAAFGLWLGMKLFPMAIYQAYSIMYCSPPLLTPFRWNYALVIGAAALLCTGLTTLGACVSTLRERPARLMMPKSPKAGKRVFLEHLPLWHHLSFLHKVTARNLLRYKKRFFMTVIGVAGCTALLLTGFGLHDSIAGIIGKQYTELCHYDLLAAMKTADSLGSEEVAALRQDNRVSQSLAVSQQTTDVVRDDVTQSVNLFVPQETAVLADFLTLRERVSGEAHTLTDTSALLTEKAAEKLGVTVGDTVTVRRTDGREASVTVGGVVENYVYSYLYLTPPAYREAFGEEPEYKLLLLRETGDADESGLSAALLDTGEVSGVSSVSDLRVNFSDVLSSMDYIVMVLIVCAGLLAFVVLYNLTNINITERQRELATLQVLGFYDGETAAYVYRENAVLTVIGLLAGLCGGVFLHRFVVHTAEVEMVMFERVITPLSFLWSALLTLVFAALVDVVMLRRLRRIDMVESMKSGE